MADMAKSWFAVAGRNRKRMGFRMVRQMNETLAACLLLNAIEGVVVTLLFSPEIFMGVETTALSWTLRSYAGCFAFISALLTLLPLCPP